ncbi:MAG: tetratricopeptide repeat protein [bacterium]
MRLHRSFALFICLTTYICLGASNETEHTEQNQQAKEWYKRGMTETSHQKRVAMFLKAIQLDPVFIDAYYQLGLSYKSLKNYIESEKALIKAYSVKPEKLKQEQKTNIMFELGSVYLRLGRLTEAEGTLQGAKDAASDIGMKAKIAFELGRVFATQSKYAQALEEFKVAKIFDPKNAARYDFFVQSTTEKLQVADVTGKTDVAKNDSPQTSNRNQSQPVSTNENAFNRFATVYQQARKYEANNEMMLALATYQNLLQSSPGYKDVRARVNALQKKIDKMQIERKVESEYAFALDKIKTKNWTRAIVALENVQKLIPGYKNTKKMLRRAQKELDRQNVENIAARYYADGLLARKKGDYANAYVAFEKVRKINHRYRNVASLLAEIETELYRPDAAETVAVNDTGNITKIDSLRQSAQAAMQKKDWGQAVASLEVLQILVPGDLEVIQQLSQARAQMQMNSSGKAGVEQTSMGDYLAVGGAVAAFLILPMVGLLILSPTTRARVYLLRGNYAAAYTIYEKLLARNPGNVKLYPTLANIYMLSGRQDERAMKVFKTVLQLNLPVQNRERIHSILAQQYVTGETTDGDAIDVLEKELQKEFARKNTN